ncbi:hypothetical protein Anas_03959 [Armadillidium nasatum]|uniref:Uncharacterized protein n=1 Tax=Armadillidium nasatum TaxID=96803 RepID=A0A5N5TLD0_9CRUS|nr:hypothetical protein Anas_13278 [Armadillidium nasatum]KAB7506975.1 hypothetical protein Anas_03959 [Armadillidium nasatum]
MLALPELFFGSSFYIEVIFHDFGCEFNLFHFPSIMELNRCKMEKVSAYLEKNESVKKFLGGIDSNK